MEQRSERCLREIIASLDDDGAVYIDDVYAKFLRKAFASAHINVLLGSASPSMLCQPLKDGNLGFRRSMSTSGTAQKPKREDGSRHGRSCGRSISNQSCTPFARRTLLTRRERLSPRHADSLRIAGRQPSRNA